MPLTLATPELRKSVVLEAEKWLGTPFAVNAAVRGAGVACGPLLVKVYGAVGIPVPSLQELGHFPIDWHQHTREERYLNILLQYTKEIAYPQMGDVAIFRLGRVFAHSAIVVEWPQVLHSLCRRSVEWADATKPPLGKLGREVKFLTPFE